MGGKIEGSVFIVSSVYIYIIQQYISIRFHYYNSLKFLMGNDDILKDLSCC